MEPIYQTEKEARGKHCPMARMPINSIDDEQITSCNRDFQGGQMAQTNCLGTACMAWAWHDEEQATISVTIGATGVGKFVFKKEFEHWLDHESNEGRITPLIDELGLEGEGWEFVDLDQYQIVIVANPNDDRATEQVEIAYAKKYVHDSRTIIIRVRRTLGADRRGFCGHLAPRDTQIEVYNQT